jgi:hypothetical protein
MNTEITLEKCFEKQRSGNDRYSVISGGLQSSLLNVIKLFNLMALYYLIPSLVCLRSMLVTHIAVLLHGERGRVCFMITCDRRHTNVIKI